MRHRPFLTACLCVGLIQTGLFALHAPPANAAGIPLGISSVSQVLLDDAHGRLLFADATSDVVLVTDLAGSKLDQIDVSQPGGMTVSPDGSTLIVLSGNEDTAALRMFDIGTCSPGTEIALPSLAYDGHVIVAGGQIWLSYSGGSVSGGLVTTPLAGGLVNTYTFDDLLLWSPELAASPTDPNSFVVVSNGAPGGVVAAVFDGSTLPPTMTVGPTSLAGWQGGHAAVSDDGTRLYVSSFSSGVAEFRMSDLSSTGRQLGSYLTGGAFDTTTANGGFIAIGHGGNAVLVSLANGQVQYEASLGASSDANAFLFSSDGSTLFMAADGAGGSPALFVLHQPARYRPDLRVKASERKVTYGEHLRVTVHLGRHGPNDAVTLVAHQKNASSRTIGTRHVGATGNAVFSVMPIRETSYEARYRGDAKTVPATDSTDPVSVGAAVFVKVIGGYAIRDGVHYFRHGVKIPTLTTVKPNNAGRRIELDIDVRIEGGRWVHGGTGTFRLGDNGTARVNMVEFPVGAFRFRAIYQGGGGNTYGKSGFAFFTVT